MCPVPNKRSWDLGMPLIDGRRSESGGSPSGMRCGVSCISLVMERPLHGRMPTAAKGPCTVRFGQSELTISPSSNFKSLRNDRSVIAHPSVPSWHDRGHHFYVRGQSGNVVRTSGMADKSIEKGSFGIISSSARSHREDRRSLKVPSLEFL